MPQVLTTALAASYVSSEAGAATTVSNAVVGSTLHTFFFTGTATAWAASNGVSVTATPTSHLLAYE